MLVFGRILAIISDDLPAHLQQVHDRPVDVPRPIPEIFKSLLPQRVNEQLLGRDTVDFQNAQH